MSIKYNNNREELKSFHAVVRAGWIIKFSTLNDCILLIFVSKYTGQVIMRYFDDENDAVDYINMTLTKDPYIVHE
jgi:hypothetical protein